MHEEEPKVLSENTICQQGGFRRVRRYLEGWHPKRGRLHFGWQGKETIEEKDVISPIKIFEVKDENRGLVTKRLGNQCSEIEG